MNTTHQPYEITFKETPRARQRQKWIRFSPSMEQALESVKEILRRECPEYSELKIEFAGQPAKARVFGILRGGIAFGKHFYFHAPRLQIVELSTVKELLIHEKQ